MGNENPKPMTTEEVLQHRGLEATLKRDRDGQWSATIAVPEVLRSGLEHRKQWQLPSQGYDRLVECAQSFMVQVADFRERANAIKQELEAAVEFQNIPRW